MNLKKFAWTLILLSCVSSTFETAHFGWHVFVPSSDMEMLCDLVIGLPLMVGCAMLVSLDK